MIQYGISEGLCCQASSELMCQFIIEQCNLLVDNRDNSSMDNNTGIEASID